MYRNADNKAQPSRRWLVEALVFLFIVAGGLAFVGQRMGVPMMFKTMMATAHDLLLNTVFFLMGVTVLSGALGRLLVEFGVIRLLETLLRPLMKPLFNLPGVAALGAMMTFVSDNPAIISLSKDKRFSSYFKKYQLISLTNFGTAFGMGLVVIVFMIGLGYGQAAFIGVFGSFIGSVISTRMMQSFVVKVYPAFKTEQAAAAGDIEADVNAGDKKTPLFQRVLNAMLDGGKTGVELGMQIIPGVLIISTFVMMFTFGPSLSGDYTGAAYEGVPVLPYLAGKISLVFEWLFGFSDSRLVAFSMTALGAVGAALGLVPRLQAEGIIDGNAVAVFTAMGMCWSGYLSTHTAMLDSLGYRQLTSKAIISHTVGGLFAGIVAHWTFVLVSTVF